MKLKNLLVGTALLVSTSVANATTTFAPTDGDINFVLEAGALTGYTLAIFDNAAAIGGMDSLVVTAPEQIFVDTAITTLNNASLSETLSITGGNFVLAVSNDGGLTWVGGDVDYTSAFTVPVANAYAITFGNISGFELVIDITPVPVPAAVWLFGSGLLGLVGVARRKV